MIPHDYVELVHVASVYLAALEHSDEVWVDRMEKELRRLLDSIRDQWVGEDRAGAVAPYHPGSIDSRMPEQPGRTPRTARGRVWARPPGWPQIEFTTDAILTEIVRYRRPDLKVPSPRWGRVLALLTGWTDEEIVVRFSMIERDLIREATRPTAGSPPEGGAA